jgi:hypothetical protein
MNVTKKRSSNSELYSKLLAKSNQWALLAWKTATFRILLAKQKNTAHQFQDRPGALWKTKLLK